MNSMVDNRITLRAVGLGALASGLFAWYTVILENMPRFARIMTATQIPVQPFMLLVFCVLLLNPLLRRVRRSWAFSTSEVMVMFLMTMVSSGISTFGLSSHLVPAVGGLFNRSWNTAQSRWDRYVEPYIHEAYFLSVPGIRERALVARQAEDDWREADTILRAARRLDGARQSVAAMERRLAEGEDALSAAERSRLEWQRSMEQGRLDDAQRRWDAVGDGLDVAVVLSDWPSEVAALRAAFEARRASLSALEEQAFEQVEDFRRGLPEPMRAIPGLLPSGDESLPAYGTRLRRLRAGLRVSGDVAAARQAWGGGRRDDARDALRRARDRLDGLVETASLEAERDRLVERRYALDPELIDLRQRVETLRAQRRLVDATEHSVLDSRIRSAETAADRLVKELDALSSELDRIVLPQLELTREVAALDQQLEALIGRLGREGVGGGAMDVALDDIDQALASMNISWRAMFAGDVPWGDWAGPLARWSLLVFLTYLMLMTFNGLIFRQWAHHEKLSYPLADLPMSLAGVGEAESNGADGGVPSVYRYGLFWIGFAISAFVLGWNIMATRQIIPGIGSIGLRFPWEPYIRDSLFAGLLPGAHHQVFFTMIGLAFLIPARISKSLWGFHVVYMVLLLVLVWLGYGVDERSFPSNMSLVLNFRGGIGGGALIVFSAMTLWTCRRYLLCMAMPGALADLDPAEQRELRLSSLLFISSSVALVLLLAYGMGAHIAYAVFCYLMIIVVTIGLVRSVAEGGVLVLQAFFGPFHTIRSVVGMDRAWTSSSLFAPLVVFYYMLFWDLKTFIAPAMANAYKVRDSLGIRRLGFHLSVWLGIVVAVVVSVATHLILSYDRGANSMNDWFYTTAPRTLFDSITDMAIANPVDTAGGRYWILTGMLVMAGLLIIRRKRFGVWHPIGLVMWIHPFMWALWFSIFLGWAFKTLVGRYGDRDTYQRFRMLFIGLIVGELVMCLFGVDLNRN